MYRFGLIASGGVMASFLFPKTVYAQSEEKKIKLSDLPIYDTEEKEEKFKVEKEKISFLRQNISEARKWSSPYVETVDQFVTSVKDKVEIGKAHSESTVELIRADEAGFTRATIITVAGLGGIIFGYRRGILRKILYGSIAATAAAAFCYPKVASEITSDVWNFVRTSSSELLNPVEKSDTADKDKK